MEWIPNQEQIKNSTFNQESHTITNYTYIRGKTAKNTPRLTIKTLTQTIRKINTQTHI